MTYEIEIYNENNERTTFTIMMAEDINEVADELANAKYEWHNAVIFDNSRMPVVRIYKENLIAEFL